MSSMWRWSGLHVHRGVKPLAAISFGLAWGVWVIGDVALSPSDTQLVLHSVRYERETEGWALGTEGARFAVDYPQIMASQQTAAASVINERLRQLALATHDSFLAGAAQDLAASFIADWREHHKESFPGGGRWWSRREVRVIGMAAGFLSVKLCQETYAGGAHPLAHARLLSIDLNDGSALSIREIVTPEDAPRLAEDFVKSLPRGLPLLSAPSQPDYVQLAQKLSMAVSTEGLMMSLDPYALTSFNQGVIEVNLPWTAIRPRFSAVFAQRIGLKP